MIRTSAKLTSLPFTRDPANVPTVDVWDDGEDYAGALAHAYLVAAAACRLVPRDIPRVDRLATGVARVTVELTRNTPANRDKAMGALFSATATAERMAAALRPEGVVYRPDGQAVAVSIPGRA